jgi:hypothetical protein
VVIVLAGVFFYDFYREEACKHFDRFYIIAFLLKERAVGLTISSGCCG